jgi:hypothetical protein
MSLVVETNYVPGIPQTAIPNFAPTAVFHHWTAGGPGRQGALGTIQHFVNTRYTTNASYHILTFVEDGHLVAMWIVPPSRAAHSLAPSQAFQYNQNIDVNVQNEWFVEVARCLPTKANDPNAGCIAVSFCGMPADLEAALQDPHIVEDYRQLARDLEAIPSMVDGPHVNHGWIQPLSRYDAGEELIPLLAPVSEDAEEPAPPPPPPPPPPTREERLAAEVVKLRARNPQAAAHWAFSVMTQAKDGLPLTREDRLAGEALYLRRVDHGDDTSTA